MQIDKEIYAKYFYFASKMIDFEQKRESNAPPFMKKLGFERMGLAVFVLEGVEFPCPRSDVGFAVGADVIGGNDFDAPQWLQRMRFDVMGCSHHISICLAESNPFREYSSCEI